MPPTPKSREISTANTLPPPLARPPYTTSSSTTAAATMAVNALEAANEQRRRLHHDADVVVVGAGVLGCAMACTLARQGRSVLLLERSLKVPDRIVGELLQPGGVAALKKLGLADCLEEIDAISAKGYQVIYHGQPVNIPYPQTAGADFDLAPIETKGTRGEGSRPEGRSFHHGRFINQLRQACAREPNITLVETEVTKTITSTHNPRVLGVQSRTLNPETGDTDKDCYFGQLTIICDGYASKFRKQYIGRAAVVRSKFYALELIDCPMPAPNFGIVILGDEAPVLLYQIGTHETRALIDVPTDTPTASPAAGGVRAHLKNIVLPSLPKQVQPCFEAALADGKIPRSMPNSWLPPSTQTRPGVIVLGDAMNMRHPLTGGGMTVAFSDVVLLSSLLTPERIPSLGDTSAVGSAMRDFHWRRKDLSSVINVLAQALYSLFAANDAQLKALQRGCFAYFKKGGNCVDGPVGLLGGITRQPHVLFYHFFAVALLSIWIVIKDMTGSLFGIYMLPFAIVESIRIFWKACVVIFPFIFSEMRR